MAWSSRDLQNLKDKGFLVTDSIKTDKVPQIAKKPTFKIVKRSAEKDYIASILDKFHLIKFIDGFVAEHKFDENRQFRFDWAIPSLMLGIEYEGLLSEKSGHLTIGGYTKDCEKYNLAAINGWMVLRYTPRNYKNIERDLLKIIDKNQIKPE